MRLLVHPQRLLRFVVAGVLLLCAASLTLHLLALRWDISVVDPDDLGGPRSFAILLRQLSTNIEANVPTWASAALLLVSALVAWGVGVAARRTGAAWHRHWTVLAVVFGYLSLDEATGLHERTTRLAAEVVDPGLLNVGWVLVPSVFAVAYIRFLRGLPLRTRRLLVVAGALYVGGAVGMDVLGGLFADRHTVDSLPYVLSSNVEELLEMLGVAVFLYAIAGVQSPGGVDAERRDVGIGAGDVVLAGAVTATPR